MELQEKKVEKKVNRVLIVGSEGCGKSTLANLVADAGFATGTGLNSITKKPQESKPVPYPNPKAIDGEHYVFIDTPGLHGAALKGVNPTSAELEAVLKSYVSASEAGINLIILVHNWANRLSEDFLATWTLLSCFQGKVPILVVFSHFEEDNFEHKWVQEPSEGGDAPCIYAKKLGMNIEHALGGVVGASPNVSEILRRTYQSMAAELKPRVWDKIRTLSLPERFILPDMTDKAIALIAKIATLVLLVGSIPSTATEYIASLVLEDVDRPIKSIFDQLIRITFFQPDAIQTKEEFFQLIGTVWTGMMNGADRLWSVVSNTK